MKKFFVLDTIANNREELFPLIKPFEKGVGFSNENRIEIYGVSEEEWCKVDTIDDADVLILPMSWNYYSKEGVTSIVLKKLQKYLSYKKPIWTFTSGDFGVAIPKLEGVTIFRSNGKRSQLSKWHKGMPVFIQDPLKKYFGKDKPTFRPYHSKPKIGFCGQANESPYNALKDILRTLLRNLKYYLGFRKELPQPLYSTTFLRAQLLSAFEKSSDVIPNFIRRKKYRAGAQTEGERQRTTREFYNNVDESDYILCVRGGGNFSVRLYETLAMGRIPIFLDTDCLLPLENSLEWKVSMVYIPFDKKQDIARIVAGYHEQLSEDEFKERQSRNRIFWEEKMKIGGFFTESLITGNVGN